MCVCVCVGLVSCVEAPPGRVLGEYTAEGATPDVIAEGDLSLMEPAGDRKPVGVVWVSPPGQGGSVAWPAVYRDGRWVSGGDMVVGTDANPPIWGHTIEEWEEKKTYQMHPHGVYATVHGTWPDGVVYYKVVSGYDSDDLDAVRAAMAYWTAQTGVQFVDATSDSAVTEYILLDNTTSPGGDDCFATLGRQGPVDVLNLPPDCMDRDRRRLHEIGHNLGLGHEHQRWDRNTLIDHHPSCVKPGTPLAVTFSAYSSGDATSVGPIDFDSLMMYHSFAFSVDIETCSTLSRVGVAPSHPDHRDWIETT